MLPASFPSIRRVLCLGAHADDIEIGCGGTLLRLLAADPAIHVSWVVLSGNQLRQQEAAAGAERFLNSSATHQVIVKNFRDSFFPFQGERLKEFFHELEQDVAPDVVFTHRRNDAHQDHRIVAEFAWCAFRDHVILEYEIPKYDGDLGQPNVFFALDEATCRRKVDAVIETYPTQHAKSWFTADTFWSLLRIRGIECQSPTGYAEGFYARKLTF